MEQHKYYIKGTVTGSRCYETYTEQMPSYELAEHIDEIEKLFLREDVDELAQYISEDCGTEIIIHGVITEIWVGVKVIDGEVFSWTEITSNSELTDGQKCALLDYLTGQFSDGYGEGLEQREFTSYTETETCEEWDEEEQEYYESDEYDVPVSCYLHLWQSENFELKFVDNVQEDKTAEKVVSSKPKCKLIGQDGNIFNLMGIASRTLKQAGFREQATEMCNKIQNSGSYNEALAIIMEYVEVE